MKTQLINNLFLHNELGEKLYKYRKSANLGNIFSLIWQQKCCKKLLRKNRGNINSELKRAGRDQFGGELCLQRSHFRVLFFNYCSQIKYSELISHYFMFFFDKQNKTKFQPKQNKIIMVLFRLFLESVHICLGINNCP